MQSTLNPTIYVSNLIATLEQLANAGNQYARQLRSEGDGRQAAQYDQIADGIRAGMYFLQSRRAQVVTIAEAVKYPPTLSATGAKQIDRKLAASGE